MYAAPAMTDRARDVGSSGKRRRWSRAACWLPLLFVNCGARSELGPAQEPCAALGEQRACQDACGPGEQRCTDGYWTACEVPVITRACSDFCGGGTQTCERGAWGTCVVPTVTEVCTSVCGSGVRTCEGGSWQACTAPRPRPPKLTTVIRDFADAKCTPVASPYRPHPDFEIDLSGNVDDRNMVLPELGSDDKPVYGNHATTPSTSGAANFDQWYRDTPDVNQRTTLELQLMPSSDDPGLFVYDNRAFFPIDGELLGNQGRNHNFHFTLETSFHFTYVGGEVFRFMGDDDLWVFINRSLAIDLGGIHRSETAEVRLDDIAASHGLVLGQIYTLNLFFAERHTVDSDFSIETTIADPGSCE